MSTAAHGAAGRSIATTLYIQAAITALFAFADRAQVEAAGDGWVTPTMLLFAVVTAALGAFCATGNPQAWGITVVFEVVFIAVGVGVLLTAGVYVVGTIIAIGALFRLLNREFRAHLTAPAPAPGGSPWAPPSGGPTAYPPVGPYAQPGPYAPPAQPAASSDQPTPATESPAPPTSDPGPR